MNVKEIRRLNLRRLIDDLVMQGQFSKQSDFAEKVKIDESYLSQMLMTPGTKGARGVSETKARQIEQKLGLEENFLDVSRNLSLLQTGDYVAGNKFADHYVDVPVYDVKAACGLGYTNEADLIKESMVFKHEFLKSLDLSINEGDAAIVAGDGHSMEPTIRHNDSILLDLRVQNLDDVVSGKVYAFVANRELRIKRLFKNINGSLRISSDNPDKTTYPDELISGDDLNFIYIKGQVKWRSGSI